MRPRIAVMFGSLDKLPPYEAALDAAGLESVRNPETLDGIDGVLLTGGTDVNPKWYGEAKGPHTQEPDDPRDEREMRLLAAAVDGDLPVLAVCRGMQLLNVALGGTLTQHIGTAADHKLLDAKEEDRHVVIVQNGSALAAIAGPGELPVNSRHHQAVKELGRGLRVTATSPSDGIVEAVEHPGKRFLLGVQWHPEDRIAVDPKSRALFAAFANAVRG